MSPPIARKSIFISHVNGDKLAELVLTKLASTLKLELGQGHEGYEIVFDRENISPGEEWRHRIYEWLEECPAAIVLISPDAFVHDKPWVRYETFYLAVRRSTRRNVIMVPVVIGQTQGQLEDEPDFEPARIKEIKWVTCLDPHDDATLEEITKQIASALKSAELPVCGARVVEGLVKAIAEILNDYPLY